LKTKVKQTIIERASKDSGDSRPERFIRSLPILGKMVRRFPWILQFTSFGIVGVSNFLIAYSIYAILVFFEVHPQIANLIAFFASVLNAYFLNRYWVFKKDVPVRASTPIRFFAVYGGNLALGVFLLYLYIDVLSINKYVVPFLSLPITVPLNYILNKVWVFKGSKAGEMLPPEK
jgi:putative flippase GtrA